MGCGATAPALQQLETHTQPLPHVVNGQDRLVIACDRKGEKTPRMYKLIKNLAERMLSGDAEFPPRALQMTSWGPSAQMELWEQEDGLYLYLSSCVHQFKKKLMTWSGRPESTLVVKVLPAIEVKSAAKVQSEPEGSAHYSEEESVLEEEVEPTEHGSGSVEVIDIQAQLKGDPPELNPFMLGWKSTVDRQTGFVLGSEDEMSRDRWVSMMKVYTNISFRCCSAHVWKLNLAFMSKLPDDYQAKLSEYECFTNLTCWRRRICFLDGLVEAKPHPAALCHTYISEKCNAENDIAHIMATIVDGNPKAVCSCKVLPTFRMSDLAPVKAKQVAESLLTYTMAVETQNSKYLQVSEDVDLPTALYGFAVHDVEGFTDGSSRSVFAFDDPGMRDRWLATLSTACEKFGCAGGIVVDRSLLDQAQN